MWQGEGRYQRQQRRVDYENVSDSMERLVDATNCPLCRLPRLNSKAEIDIMTHLALWASQDWKKVDRIVVGNIATASQTQRKWCTNVISKSLVTVIKLERYVFFFFWVFSFFSRWLKKATFVKNYANILFSEPKLEEKMPVYIRLGISYCVGVQPVVWKMAKVYCFPLSLIFWFELISV